MLCDCSVAAVGGERLHSPLINNTVAFLVFSHLFAVLYCFLSSFPSASAMGKSNKRKREPTPPSEDFGDSEYSEEEFSSESEGSPAPISPPASSADSDDSQGLTAEVWTNIRVVERSGLEGSDESEYSSDEEDSSEEGGGSDGGDDDNDDGGDGDDDDDDGDDDDDDSDGGSRGGNSGGKCGNGGSSRGSGGGGSSKGSNKASGL
jgi:hypothetical protein